MAVFTQASILVRRFLYRFPRRKTEVSMDLILGDTVLLGVCLDISESGLRGTFSNPVASGATGLLTLYLNDRSYQVHAQIKSVRNDDVRVRFCFDSDQECENIQKLISLLPVNPSSLQK